ncbi:GTP-binding protein [Cytobacillus sp. S13-E01]|uniref:CobW family GTP-binding protein n=1 Tax=Cytobacillus sp. S13-E01 TaxID=3031326 RepID=UPI0023D81353|nr:GTP-binding protein [Cytobacillus sp. S13-E01]MDF0726321.1 GTP-binding protein [Cytobacillus sp. S13-E01]
MKKVEVYILAGFLGSGKTTLLKNLLTEEKQLGRRVAVVMNELGQTSIDSNEVSEDIPLKELLNGCVCCTIQGQLEVHMHGLLNDHELDSIYIETTGVAHPIEVLDACLSPLFADKLDVQSIVTIVDANRWKDRHGMSIRLQKLLQEQVRHADVLLINKVDQLTEAEQGSIIFDIQSVNPKAKCLLTRYSAVRLEDLSFKRTRINETREKAHVQHDLRVKTFVHQFQHPLNIDIFENWLRAMPDTIYRIKGYLRFTHSDNTFLFQYSYGMPLYMKEMLKYPLTLVFIGEDLNPSWMEAEMKLISEQSAFE